MKNDCKTTHRKPRALISALTVFAILLIANCSTYISAPQFNFASAAVHGDRVKVSEALAGGDVDVNAQNGVLGPALVSAASFGHTDVVRLLLESGADINIRDESTGTTALMTAVIEGHPEVVRLLIENGADTKLENGKSKNGEVLTALTYARFKGNPEIIRLLDASRKE